MIGTAHFWQYPKPVKRSGRAKCFILEYDPEGVYVPGLGLYYDEISNSLRWKCFAPGTIFKRVDGTRYKVVNGDKGHRLEEL